MRQFKKSLNLSPPPPPLPLPWAYPKHLIGWCALEIRGWEWDREIHTIWEG